MQYALSPYITQIRFGFKGLNNWWGTQNLTSLSVHITTVANGNESMLSLCMVVDLHVAVNNINVVARPSKLPYPVVRF